MKFTYKKDIPTGRFRSFELEHHDIKLKKKVIGHIYEDRECHKFHIQIAVNKKDIITSTNPNCTWKWVFLKKEFSSANEAREFLDNKCESICSTFDLYYFEE
jgi:hypothetical protein